MAIRTIQKERKQVIAWFLKQPFSATTDLNFENRSEHRIYNRVHP